MSDISAWSTSAASNSQPSPDGFPEGMAPSGVNDSAREVMGAVRRWYIDAEWVNFGAPLVYQSANSFLVSATATQIYTSGRRLKLNDTSTVYGKVLSSSPSGANTVVTVSSSNLSSSLSSGFVSIMNPVGHSIPGTQWSSTRGLAANNTASANIFASISAVSLTLIGRNVSPVVLRNPAVISIDLTQAQAGSVAGRRDQATSFSNADIHFYAIHGNGALSGLGSLSGPASFNGSTLPSGYNRWSYLFTQPMSGATLSAAVVRGSNVYYQQQRQVLSNGQATTETTVSLANAIPAIAASYALRVLHYYTTAPNVTSSNDLNIYAVAGAIFYSSYIDTGNEDAHGSVYSDNQEVSIPNTGYLAYAFTNNFSSRQNASLWIDSYKVPNGDV